LLNKFEIVSIFSNIEAVLEVNNKLLADLESGERSLGAVFRTFAREFKRPYALYCSNQPNVRTTLRGYLDNNVELDKLCKAAFRQAESRKLDLESFLIRPLQRLCKYPLLLKAIQKEELPPQENADELQTALDEIRAVVDDVNDRVREVENLVKLMSVANSIANSAVRCLLGLC
jgi:cell fate (sporulation/competence/biofilm development) regulator YmcA (YheA/YmcA/DUF963 family)